MPEETYAIEPPIPAKSAFGAPKQAIEHDISGTTEQLNLMAARVRISEERYSELRKKLLLVEQNMLSNHKKAMAEIKLLQNDVTEMRRTIQAVEDKIITIIKELRLAARKEDIDVMKRYLELWDPVKFVTADRIEKIIDEKLGKHEETEKPNYDSPS
ncbi:MAG: hypothetical protein QW165_00565 [Candidatus Woesearchaeota archaeon]